MTTATVLAAAAAAATAATIVRDVQWRRMHMLHTQCGVNAATTTAAAAQVCASVLYNWE